MAAWIPDFDDYFLSKLSTITVPNEHGVQETITACYYLPGREKDADADQKRPAIVFSQYDMVHDISRECSAVKIKVGGTPTEISLKDAPVPWNLYYEFRILSDYKEHNVLMDTQFLRMFPPRGYILVPDPETGKMEAYDFFLHIVMQGDSYLQTNSAGTTEKRIFRKVYRFILKTEADFATVENFKRVLDRTISARHF